MKLNDMLSDLLELARQENEPNRYAHSEEYDKLYNELDRKTFVVDCLEKRIGCSLEVILAALEKGIYNEYYCYIPPYRLREVDIFTRENFYYDDETNGFTVKLSDYKKTWWLKEDRSE